MNTYINAAHILQESHGVSWLEYNSLYPYLVEAKVILIKNDMEAKRRDMEAQARGSTI